MSSTDDAPVVTEAVGFVSPFLKDHDRSMIDVSALVVLNSPIPADSVVFRKLWDLTSFRICADGGANRLYDSDRAYVPHCIRGDLDSLRSDVREYYGRKGCTIDKDACQDTNDLDKSLQVCSARQCRRIYVYGAFGGRFDQEMASMQALYAWGDKFGYQLYMYNDETCAFLVPASTVAHSGTGGSDGIPAHTIRLRYYGDDDETGAKLGEGPTCGLIPLSCRCDTVATSGFRWDLDGTVPLQFGGLVSTSNRAAQSELSVRASQPVIFTAEVHNGKDQ